METNTEYTIQSPINGTNECFVEMTGDTTSYFCLGTGYMSNSTLTPASDDARRLLSKSPQLIRDMKIFDKGRGIYWIPCTVETDAGIIFPDSTPEGSLQWVFARYVPIADDMKAMYTGFDVRLDTENAMRVERDDFRTVYNALFEANGVEPTIEQTSE